MVRARALDRLTGINKNRQTLNSPEKLKKAFALADQYRSKVVVTDRQKEFAILDKEYSTYKGGETSSNANYTAEVEQKAVAGGSLNPYDKEVTYAALQGYAFMKTPLMAMGTKYDAVPVELCDIERLNQLIITSNNVAKIPAEIGKLKNLKVLDLKNNKLTALPEEIGQLASLEKLDLAGNQITKLPASIGQLKKLTTLGLKGNPIAADEMARITAALPGCKVKF